MIAGNYSNNFQYVPHWLWDKHVSPTEFVLYMALRSFAYPTGPTINELVAKTGLPRPVIEQTLASLQEADLAAPCLRDQFGDPCDDRWVFNYLKNTANAPAPAPAPVADDIPPGDYERWWRHFSGPRITPTAEHEAFLQAVAQQERNLGDPTYLRSPGPINPDICGMVDEVKYTYWRATAMMADIHYRLAELTGLGLLDPDANHDLQHSLVTLYEILYCGTVCAVRDPNDGDDLYYDEFDNTFSDGREIRLQIRVEPLEESDYTWPFNRFIAGDGATNDYPRGAIYHINPVRPGDKDPEG